jgi:pilus assembly protein CpaB
MTVNVDQVAGVAGFVNPGNMVDVVLTTTPPGSAQSLSKIVLQNVHVLAVGQTVENREGKAAVVPTVTMDVTPGDAENLAIASTQGKLQLILRRAGDTALAKTGGATVTKVISGAAVAEMPKAKVSTKAPLAGVKHMGGTTSVEVWRGNKKSVETFTVKEGGV